MRYVFIFCFAFCWQVCLAQGRKYDGATVHTVAFYKEGDSLDSAMRIVPEDLGQEFPYYVLLGSKNFKFIHLEFLRKDTARYFVREYFKGSSLQNENVKSFGDEIVAKKAVDSGLVDMFDKICGDKTESYLAARHLLTKEGEWNEFENFTDHTVFWRGTYVNNKKAGIWKRMLTFDEDTSSLEEIDYQKDSTLIYGDNDIRKKSLVDLKVLLQGEWFGVSDNGYDKIRCLKNSNFLYRYKYKNECYMLETHYQFNKSGRFINYLREVKQGSLSVSSGGRWSLRQRADQTFIDLVYDDKEKNELNLIYYNRNKGLYMILNKHPQPSK